MALTPDGNYYANLPDPPAPTGFTGNFGSGVGAPSISTAVTRVYTNTSNGDFYDNTDGTTSGWVLVGTSGGASGGQIVRYTSGTPANPADTSKPAVAYDPNGNLPGLGWDTDSLSWK